MTQDNIVKLSQPGTFSDPLTEVLRGGARALLAHAVEAEVAGFLGGHAYKLTDDGHRRLVRHWHLPEREIMTGIGPVSVRCPRFRDRAAVQASSPSQSLTERLPLTEGDGQPDRALSAFWVAQTGWSAPR